MSDCLRDVFSRGEASRRRRSGQGLAKWLDHDVAVDTRGDERIGVGPGLGGGQGVELGDDQAAGETCGARVVAVDGRVWAGEDHAAFGVELLQALKVRRACRQAFFQGVFNVCGNDRVEHVSPRFFGVVESASCRWRDR